MRCTCTAVPLRWVQYTARPFQVGDEVKLMAGPALVVEVG